MSQPLMLAALILNYRRSELTIRCVRSLGHPIHRIYVIDNSGDPAEFQRLASGLPSDREDRPEIRLLATPANLGFARGLAWGLASAQRDAAWDAYWIMNNDATAEPDLVGAMVRAFEAHGRRALVAPRTSREGVPSRLWYHRLFGLVMKRPIWGAFPYLNGACLLVSAQAAEPHLFDPDFFLYGEDAELSWRLARQGFTLVEVDAGFHHDGQATTRNGSLFYEFHVARGHLLLAHKLAVHPGERWLLLAGRLVSLPLRASVRTLRSHSLVPWRALIAALCRPEWKPDPPGVDPIGLSR